MKRTLSISVLILLFGLVSGQTVENIPDGYQIFKYPNGAKSSEGNIKNGKPDGFWKSYYVTGIKKSEGKRTNFLLDSIWVFFDQTGDTIEKINYLYGKKNGYYYKFKKDPSEGLYIWSKELFAGDKKEGTSYIYFPDHRIQQTITWNNGKRSGLSKEFDHEGLVITLLEYNNDFLISREKINRKDGNGLKQGDWKEFYPGGNIKTEKTFRDDLLHGYYKEYDAKGNLVLTMLYDNGAIVKSNVEDQPDIEIRNKYDQNGKLIYSGPFRNSVPVGIHREYNAEGKISGSKIYNDNGLLVSEGIVNEQGERNGKWSDFFPDGRVMDEGQYTDNRRSGSWKFYSQEGKTEQTGYFNNGRPDGMWKWYYETGTLLREEEYFQGKRDGAYTEYSRSGEIIAQGQYSDGERNGEWKFKSANNTETGKYITGLKDGVWKSYYSDGKLRFKGSFLQGMADGQHMLYYESGKLKEERYYQGSLRVKTWKKYDEDGKVILTVSYRNDTEVSINGVKIKLPENDVKIIK